MKEIQERAFGHLSNKQPANLYTIINQQGASVSLTDYGASVVRIMVPDKFGNRGDIALGYDSVEEYESHDNRLGATCGRVAARLANGHFVLNGTTYETSKNEMGTHTLHGGFHGFDVKLWNTEIKENKIIFSYVSPDGEEGFPGELHTTVSYSFSEENELFIEYSAWSDQDTIVNLTNHIYFNLAGHEKGTVRGHQVQLFSDYYLPCDGTPMPDGQILRVENTPLDFRSPTLLDQQLDSDFKQISVLGGINHEYLLNKTERKSFEQAGIIKENTTGRKMEIFTTEPCIHFFTSNNLTKQKGKRNADYHIHGGFCLEPGVPANSMQFLHFPSPVLKANQVYCQKTSFRFSCDGDIL